MISLDTVEDALELSPGELFTGRVDQRASVALVLRETDGDLALLFIERGESEGDPWSGHIAFPGGRCDPDDQHARETAERETLEELTLDLARARLLGRLDDLPGREASLVVSGFVYGVEGDPPLSPNYEVARTIWLPLRDIERPKFQLERAFRYRSHTLMLPALRVFEGEGAVLWGLSYRFLELLMARLGRPIPAMPWDSNL